MQEHTAQLSINLEVLLIEDLQNGVQQTTQWSIGGLLDDLCTSLPAIMFGSQSGQPVDVHNIVGIALVGTAENELKLLRGYANGLENCRDNLLVVFDTVLDQFEGRFHGVQECVHIGKEDNDLTTCGEQLGNLDCGDEVSGVRPASSGGTWKLKRRSR